MAATTLRIFERIGRQLQALGVPDAAQFNCGVGAPELHPRRRRAERRVAPRSGRDTDRAAFLAPIAAPGRELDPDDYPFTRTVAAQLRDHDDREQFLAGIDLVLAGIRSDR